MWEKGRTGQSARVFTEYSFQSKRRKKGGLGPSAARDGEGRPHRRQRESAWLRKTSIGSLPISGRRRKRRWAGRRWAQRRWSRRLQEAAFRKTAVAAHASDSWRQQPYRPTTGSLPQAVHRPWPAVAKSEALSVEADRRNRPTSPGRYDY